MSRGVLVGTLVVMIAAVSGASALADNSFLTHLTTGRMILDGHFPRTDPYSFTAHGEPWIVQSWFASVVYALGERIGNGVGIRLIASLLSAILAGVLWRLTRPARTVASRLLAVVPMILIGTVTWGYRPLLFGLVGFALVLLVLTEERDPRWLVPVMWVWVNTHGSFPLGLVLVVVYGIGVRFDRGSIAHVLRTLEWVVLGTLLGAVNPIGPKLLWFPVDLLRRQQDLAFMLEWQAPRFTDTWQRIFLLMVVVSVALVPRLPSGRRYRLIFPALVFLALGLTSTRNMTVASFAFVPLLAAGVAGLGGLSDRVRSRVHDVVVASMALLTIALVGLRLAGPSFDLRSYPVGAIDQLDRMGRLGSDHRIAAPDFVGNYLEFRTDGRTLIFVDDRVDMFPASVIDDEKTLFLGRSRWSEVLDRWHIDTVLWQKESPLGSLLAESQRWRMTGSFEDEGSSTTWVIYERIGS